MKLSRQISRYPWQHAMLLFGIFFVSWYGIYHYKLYQLKQDTIRTSEQLLNQISVQSMKNKQDIHALYSQIKSKSGDQDSQLKTFIEFFKQHAAVESIFFSTQANGITTLLNPYLSNSMLFVSKEACDAALNRHAIDIDSNQEVAVVSELPKICIYDATRQITIVMNVRNNIHRVLQAEVEKGYFVAQYTNHYAALENNLLAFSHEQTFDYLGMSLMYTISPNQAYVDKQLELALFIALLVTGTFLIVLLLADKMVRFKYEKINHSKIFELGYLRKLVFYDQLTGLPNRKYLLLRLRSTLFRAKQYRSSFSLCFIDCDNFKQINDHYGHHVGDCLLGYIAQIVTQKVRDKDFFSRLSGDEFCLILDGCVSNTDIHVALTKILSALAEPVTLDTHTISITVSIGVIVCTGSSQSPPEQLLIKADRAMYQAKHRQKGTYAIVYEDEPDEGLNTQVE